MSRARIAVLVSGGGTNLQALLDAERSGILHSGKIVLVVSNNPDACALQRAANAGVETAVLTKKGCGSQEAFEQALAETLEQAQAYSEEADENARLRQALGLEQRGSEYTLESAKIVTWNASNWKSGFTISKGESSGIGYGDCVVTEYGAVVGTVSELGRGWATVSTVVDARCALGALVGVDRYAAQLQGDFVLMRRGEVYLSGYPAGAAIEPGDEVLTSGSEGVVPQGANIGTVSAVNDDGSVVVAPAADLDSLVQVFVIKEFSVEE